jgi:hypothetical protein
MLLNKFGVVLGLLFSLTACDDVPEYSQKMDIQDQLDVEMDLIYQKVAQDSVDQYFIVKRQGDSVSICMQASMVSAAYLQAKDEANYQKWKRIESEDCATSLFLR